MLCSSGSFLPDFLLVYFCAIYLEYLFCMMKMSVLLGAVFVVIFGVLIPVSHAHLCVVNPAQRGVMGDLNTKGSHGCFQTQGPCGTAQPPQYPHTIYVSVPGETFNLSVIFQKNLDHYNSASPGYFSVALGSPTRKFPQTVQFKEVARVADSATPSLHVYAMTVPIPNILSEHYILQVSYVTKNPNAPAAFYQCTDFALIALPTK